MVGPGVWGEAGELGVDKVAVSFMLSGTCSRFRA